MKTTDQRDSFMAFWENELAGGALPFTMPHPFKDTVMTALFDPEADIRYTPLDSVGAWRVDTVIFELP